ncbi:MAG: hypothetical protein IJZ08_04235 [Clostridia bacterium]|nr:hypothetical protein [Clostridia bacterium]
MNAFWKKITSAALALVLLLGAVPALPVQADDTALEASAGKTVYASYSDTKISVNGKLTEEGWAVHTILTGEVLLGARWNMTTLYLTTRTPNKESVTIKLNGTEITKSNAEIKSATNKKATEYGIDLSVIGVTVNDYGTEIPAEITVDGTVWKGTVVLSSKEWFIADNPSKVYNHSGIRRGGMRIVHPESKATPNQNITTITGGYNFFDRYDPNGNNPLAPYSRLTYAGDTYAPLGDRTADTVFGFFFCAKSMPEYRLGVDNDFYPYIVSGFNWYISAAGDKGTTYVTMAIVNTDIGLVFSLRDADRDRTYILNKYEGDTFHIETKWTTDGDIILYIDGEQVAVFENAEMTAHDTIGENNIVFNLLRSTEIAKSAEDNFDIDVTCISVGKEYGESIVDSISFETIRKMRNEQTLVRYDMNLVTSFANKHFTSPVDIEWSSSDPAVIDPATGKVTQPAASGKKITLTAVAPSLGTSKSIDVFVPGLNPQEDVLVVRKDTATYKGVAKPTDQPEFTFDENNNSIVRDLKEAKTVNVIVLKDSDTVCRLNSNNLTIWTSDDNETYTEVESFKLLRDGMYTYLYDFEATGRYIKVHCTLHSSTDADFTAPLDGMIDAYYEDVFGGGDTSFATESAIRIDNGTDAVGTDAIVSVSPEVAGVSSLAENYADVRFLLDSEILYHYYDGENFLVRVPEIAANGNVTVKVLSGNAQAKDISNIEAIYEVMYGTRETYSGYRGSYFITLNNGMMMGFHGQGGQPYYYISQDGGITTSSLILMKGAADAFANPHGAGYDETTGRIFVHGYKQVNGKNVGAIVYSDNNGKLWKKAEINYEMEGDEPFSFTYADFVKVSSYDGEDGPNVDFVLATCRDSEAMREHYDNGYYHGEMTTMYTTDNGKTWTKSADAVRYYGGDDIDHIREHGLCEVVCMENDEGVLFLYSRCQYEETLHFGYGVSYDFGKTWSEEAELSNIYTTNTQPELFKMGGHSFIMWGGNNVYGGGSYRRYPLNVAVSYDGLYTFTDIQDLFLRTDFQGMVNGTCINAMNPNVTVSGDTMFVSSISDIISEGNNYRVVYVYNFLDYFFKTKGAYDSFEDITSEYEGWAATGGQVEASDAQAAVGEKSMMFTPGSAAVRSLPAVSDGTVAFDLYIEDVTKADLTFELETSHGPDYGKASPIGFALNGNSMALLRGENKDGMLKNGWNHFEFDLSLSADTPSATLSVNGSEAFAVPVEAEIGDYICYVHIVCQGALTYYLDAFIVDDTDDSVTLTAAAVSATGTDDPEDTTSPDDPSVPGTDGESGGMSPIVWIGIAAVVILAIVGALIAVKKKKN